ncbi:MAG: hypothetical protein GXY20_07265 [Clostridiales bacterium]|nr:hypothetical protein [Clostridiales bacterium]
MPKSKRFLVLWLIPAATIILLFFVSSSLLSGHTSASETYSPSPMPMDYKEANNSVSLPVPSARVALTAEQEYNMIAPSPKPERVYKYTDGHGTPIYDYSPGDIVPESESVDDVYFSGAVFLGDSRTQGFQVFSGLTTADIYAGKSLSVISIYTDKVISRGNGVYVTVMEALGSKVYDKVYIMLGINEIGLEYDYFHSLYADVIDSIIRRQPHADIYIQANLPVSEEKDKNGGSYNNTRVRAFNEELKELCSEKSVHYIDLYTAFANEDGNLCEGMSGDGIHLVRDACVIWLDYLKTHTIVHK